MRKFRSKDSETNYTVIAIIVESAALYAICGLVFIPIVAKQMDLQIAMFPVIGSLAVSSQINAGRYTHLYPIMPHIQVISPTLIVLRIALGTAATATTVSLPTFIVPTDVDVLFQPSTSYGQSATTMLPPTASAQFDVFCEPPVKKDDHAGGSCISDKST